MSGKTISNGFTNFCNCGGLMIMARAKKYYKKLSDARKALAILKRSDLDDMGVYKMPKGSRHHGMYAVCSFMEWLNSD